jgi:imidazolonepropionase-like amidohydrolase
MLRIVVLLLAAFAAGADTTVFVGVNVLPMDTERVLLGQSVVVRDGVIAEIGAVDAVAVPGGARVIYGRGRWLVPGLIDMHVHIRAVDLPRYIAYGITTVRDLAGLDSVLAAKRSVDSGAVLGPRIFVSSLLLVGPQAANPPFSHVFTNPADAQRVVDAQLARGCDSIKVYEDLSRASYDALIAAARARGVKVAGHVTGNVDVRYAMTRQDSIEHLSGYPLGIASLNRELAQAAAASGVWNCPTMYVFRTSPQTVRDARRALLTALDEAGARILAGTDSGYLVPAGIGLHEELRELREAGLTPFETLSAATRSAAEYLGDSSIGTIHIGARADLLLVAVNPLENLSTLRAPSGVMVGGRWLSNERSRAVRH